MSEAPAGPVLSLEETYERVIGSAAFLAQVVDVVTVTGPDASSWLQGQLSQNLDPVQPGESVESLVLSPQGKVDSYCSAVRSGEETWRLVVRSGHGEALLARLARFKLRVRASLSLEELPSAVVRGPEAGALTAELAASWPVLAEIGVDWPNWQGRDLVFYPANGTRPVPSEPVSTGAPAGFEAARIEGGVPVLGREITERTIPQEAGLLAEHTVSFSKGCYTGQELVARIDARGGNVPRRLRLVVVPGALDEHRPPARGQLVVSGGATAGEITSVAWSPSRRAHVALCYLKRGVSVPSRVEVDRGEGAPALEGEALAVPGTTA